MIIEVQQAPAERRYILQNMWIAYAHELSQYHGELPNMHGLLGEPDDSYDPDSFLAEWWEENGLAAAHFITVESRPAGFALITAAPLLDGGADYSLEEFFLFYPYRGKGIGKQAAAQLLAARPGRWQLSVMQENVPALSFWRRVVPVIADGAWREREGEDGTVAMVEFQFAIARPA